MSNRDLSTATATKRAPGGRRSRAKGARGERAVVTAHHDAGVMSERVPLSGAAGGSYTGDVTVTVEWLDAPLLGEVKTRKGGFKQLYDFLGENDFLVVRQDRRERLYVVREATWLELIKRGEG